ncbi:MAG: Rieske 2Fe-2S domain-containing protein [Candidatus Bathyarchaeia archaeon]|jgi:arsenite oxidase small subunit
MKSTNASQDDKSKGRRSFLKLLVAIGAVSATAAGASVLRFLAYVPSSSTTQGSGQLMWPRVKLVNAKSLQVLKPVSFNYPLMNTPNILVKLGVKAEDGIRDEGDIVAYSGICQHLGCYYAFLSPGSSPSCDSSFEASIPQGYCCCHGGQYDLAQSARVIGGPPPRPVPAVKLDYDSDTGDIYAVGMGPPTIFGHGPPGTTDPALVLKYDLQGGEIVTQATVFSGT